ncbi:MAG TPA: ECF-type sigma factor [Gemmataceae bacterium]|jgi:RNA polymerase sigma factor (sigma-70 family)
MSESGSITALIERVQEGDHEAARLLWQRYYPRMVALARQKLKGFLPRVADEEDAALSAFNTFCDGAEKGHFPDLKNRDELWALLVVLTARKVADMLRSHRRKRHGEGMVRGDSAFQGDEAGLDDLPGNDLTPLEEVVLAEEVETLLQRLREPVLRQIAVWKLEAYTNAEIADRLGCSQPTVERRLAFIRRLLREP